MAPKNYKVVKDCRKACGALMIRKGERLTLDDRNPRVKVWIKNGCLKEISKK